MSRVSAGDVYWIVACSAADQGRENIYSILRNRVQKNALVSDSAVFDVPLNLKFGSFDDLIRMADDLVKHDNMCEQIVRRLERQVLDINPSAEIRIFFQRSTMSMEQFLHRFMWDEAKYSKTRYMKDNIDILISTIARIDEEVRIKSAAYNESKHSHQSATKKETSSLSQKDLIHVLTPQVVLPNDFIETKHLTTVVAIVPSGCTKSWLESYESLSSFVVPRSTRKFDVTDKENNTLWKVTLFKKHLDTFKANARTKRFVIREFKYSPDAYQGALAERSRLEAEKNKQESFMSRVCLASFSDACIAWLHIKAMRVFTESILRFGIEPNFAAFLLKPRPGKEKKLRKELEDVFTTEGMFGRAFIENVSRPPSDNTTSLAVELGNEEYYSYVSLSLIPLQFYSSK